MFTTRKISHFSRFPGGKFNIFPHFPREIPNPGNVELYIWRGIQIQIFLQKLIFQILAKIDDFSNFWLKIITIKPVVDDLVLQNPSVFYLSNP